MKPAKTKHSSIAEKAKPSLGVVRIYLTAFSVAISLANGVFTTVSACDGCGIDGGSYGSSIGGIGGLGIGGGSVGGGGYSGYSGGGGFGSTYGSYSGIGCTTLRTPLIPSAGYSGAGQAADPGMPPPPGCGDGAPPPVTPGMTGGPTYEPWVTRIPANQIDQTDSEVSVPITPADALPPGTVGPMCNTPAPPSTPGQDPGMLRNPAYAYQSAAEVVAGFSSSNLTSLSTLTSLNPAKYRSSAAIVTVPPGGKYPDNQAPLTKRYGQATRDFGLYRNSGSLTTDFGQRVQEAAPLAELNPKWGEPLKYSQDGSKPVVPHAQTKPIDPHITHDLGVPFQIMSSSGGSSPRQYMTPLTTIAPQ